MDQQKESKDIKIISGSVQKDCQTEEEHSFQQIHSQDSISESDQWEKQKRCKMMKQGHISKDGQYRQRGQSEYLMPVQDKQGLKEESESASNRNQNQKKEEQNNSKQIPLIQNMETNKQNNTQIKTKYISVDSKVILAAYEVLLPQIKQILPKGEGFVSLNTDRNWNSVIIGYYKQSMLRKAEQKLDELLSDLEIIPMSQNEAQSGVQISYKYQQQLLRQRISFFKDFTQKYKSQSYYICGMVQNKMLRLRLEQIKNVRFSWFHLREFQNTRSYRAVLRNIFSSPEIKLYVKDKFQAVEIQVAQLKRHFEVNIKQKKGALILLTFLKTKKITNHQQIEDYITKYIQQQCKIICFVFTANKASHRHKYLPKLENVTWFAIHDRNGEKPLNFLFIIVRSYQYEEVKNKIIEEIGSMGIVINGRRFFRGFHPTREEVMGQNTDCCRISSYPKVKPYSWTFGAKKDQKFNWKTTL